MIPRATMVLAAVAMCALQALAAAPPQNADEVPRIDQAEFKQAFAAQSVVVIDVRNELAYNAGHVPGAWLWNADAFDRQLAELRATKKTVVLYCNCPSEHSSAVVGLQLIQGGLTSVKALKGGLVEWQAAGNPVAKGSPR